MKLTKAEFSISYITMTQEASAKLEQSINTVVIKWSQARSVQKNFYDMLGLNY